KDPFWNERRAPKRLREYWAILANTHLELAGQDARIDPRRLAEQGIARTPGNKRHPSLEALDKALEHQAAVGWWERTKQQLQIQHIQGQPREALLQEIRAKAEAGLPGHWLTAEERTQRLTQALAEVEARLRPLEAEERLLTRLLAQRGTHGQGQHRAPAAAAERHEEGLVHGRLRVRLFDDERGRGGYER